MRKLLLEIEENKYSLFLKFLKTLDYVKVNSPQKRKEGIERNNNRYDFSDLIGKLQWNGDAVLEQRKLRDEW